MKLWERPETKSNWVLPVLKKVHLEISADEGELEQLRTALGRMACAGHLDLPWRIWEEGLIRDIIGPVVNTWKSILRGHLEQWTSTVWREVYRFWKRGVKRSERNNHFLEREFRNPAHRKDGYTIRNLWDSELRRVIGFLNPIFYPEKPNRVVSLWASTFIGSFNPTRIG